MKKDSAALIVGGAVLFGLLYALSQSDQDAVLVGTGPASPPIPRPPKPAEPSKQPLDTSDRYALARMLESETRSRAARVVIGWITMETARRRGSSIFDVLTAPFFQYGPRRLNGIGRYADTSREPSQQALDLAGAILLGVVKPSAEIRNGKISAWVEWLPPKTEAQAAELINQQTASKFGGLWRRIAGTDWFLYSSAVKPTIAAAGAAAAALRKVRIVQPLENAVS